MSDPTKKPKRKYQNHSFDPDFCECNKQTQRLRTVYIQDNSQKKRIIGEVCINCWVGYFYDNNKTKSKEWNL